MTARPGRDAITLHVLAGDPTPPYEQLRRQLVGLIGSGALRAGERLPPLRQLAGDLGLAVGTVARTYRELEGAGLVVSRRGGGTRVSAVARPDVPCPPDGATERSGGVSGTAEDPPAPGVAVDDLLHDMASDLVGRARAVGATDSDVRRAVERSLSGLPV